MMSTERLARTVNALRQARLTGSLTAEERRAAAVAEVPSETEQKRYLAQLAEALERSRDTLDQRRP
jgi:hypothetical protein